MAVYKEEYKVALVTFEKNDFKVAARTCRYILNNSLLPRYWQLKNCILIAHATDDYDEAGCYLGVAEEIWELLDFQIKSKIKSDFHEHKNFRDREMLNLRTELDQMNERLNKGDSEVTTRVPWIELQPRDESGMQSWIEGSTVPTDRLYAEWPSDMSDEEEDDDEIPATMAGTAPRALYHNGMALLGTLYNPVAMVRRSLFRDPDYQRMWRQKYEKDRAEANRQKRSTAASEDAAQPPPKKKARKTRSKHMQERYDVRETVEDARETHIFAAEEGAEGDQVKSTGTRIIESLTRERAHLLRQEKQLKEHYEAQMALIEKRKYAIENEMEAVYLEE